MNRKCFICGKLMEYKEFKIKPLIENKKYYICSKECHKKFIKLWVENKIN